MKLLDEALNDLAQGNATTLGAADLYYKGDAAKWTKAVYALKARYTMRLLGRSADRTGDLNKILDYASKSFTSADEEMKLAKLASFDAVPLFIFKEWAAVSQTTSHMLILWSVAVAAIFCMVVVPMPRVG